MRVLLTGHKGYIGCVMAPILKRANHEVIGLDSDLYRNCTYGEAPPRCEEIIKDVRDVERSDLEGIDAIVHLAGLSNDSLGNLDPDLTYDINHRASVRLAAMGKEVGVRRFVFASSCSNYGVSSTGSQDESGTLHPLTAYAKSKVLVEQDVSELASEDFTPVFMRNATAYGASPRMRFDLVLNNFTAWARTTGKILLKSDGTPWRPLVHIADISRAVVAALAADEETIHNQAFNVGSNSENYQMGQLAHVVKEVLPEAKVTLAPGAEPDKRNYRVCFDKYDRAFPEYKPTWKVRDGVTELSDFYHRNDLQPDVYEGPQYKRIAQIRKLLDTGELADDLRWRN